MSRENQSRAAKCTAESSVANDKYEDAGVVNGYCTLWTFPMGVEAKRRESLAFLTVLDRMTFLIRSL